MARKLSVVTESTPAPESRPATIKAAVEMTERALLVALRTKIAIDIDGGVPAHALAPLMRQLRELDKEIRAIDARTADGHDDPAAQGSEADADAPFDAASL